MMCLWLRSCWVGLFYQVVGKFVWLEGILLFYSLGYQWNKTLWIQTTILSRTKVRKVSETSRAFFPVKSFPTKAHIAVPEMGIVHIILSVILYSGTVGGWTLHSREWVALGAILPKTRSLLTHCTPTNSAVLLRRCFTRTNQRPRIMNRANHSTFVRRHTYSQRRSCWPYVTVLL